MTASPEDHSDLPQRAEGSPWQPPSEHEPQPSDLTNPSVFAEPWMQNVQHRADESDAGPGLLVGDVTSGEHSVWDEPGLSPALAGGVPEDAVTWFRWYEQQVARTSAATTWLVTLGVVLLAGVAAIVGTMFTQMTSAGVPLLAVTVIGPTTEEIMKIALPLWLVEKRPWWYRNGGQILLCAVASGLAFAAVENLIYLHVYIPDASASLAVWRWTVCVLLHSGCSAVAGVGVWRVWHVFQREQRAPQLYDGGTWIVAAIVLHGLYNGSVTLLELGGLDF